LGIRNGPALPVFGGLARLGDSTKSAAVRPDNWRRLTRVRIEDFIV
jgi:hypothetical protein